MKKLLWLSSLALLCLLGSACLVSAQVVDRKLVDNNLSEGEVGKAEKILRSYLKKQKDLTFQDSVYIFKNLGVICSSNPKKIAEADKLFFRLFELDPFASIHDTYASNSQLVHFKKIKKEVQAQKGGKALIPSLAVMDIYGKALRPEDQAGLTRQLIAELQSLPIFHTLDRNAVEETLEKKRVTSEKCENKECILDVASRLTTDKILTVSLDQIDTNFTLTATLYDLESGTSTNLKKVFAKAYDKLLSPGLGDFARALQEQEAAWLNLSLIPTGALITIDGTTMGSNTPRFPLNPGKHEVCGSSPGYQNLCKSFVVKKNDALTYAMTLPLLGGSKAAEPAPKTNFDEEGNEEEPVSKKANQFLWWTVGGMAGAALLLIVLFSSK